MGFLDTLSSIVGIGSTIAGAVGSANAAFSDRDSTPAERQMAEAIKQAMGIAPDAQKRAAFGAELSEMLAAGESDPRFASLVGEEDGRLRNDYIQAVDMYLRQGSRIQGRGLTTGINPERRDEMRAGSLMNAFEDSRSKARASARELLKSAANANNLSLQGYTNTMGALTGAGQAAGAAIPSQVDAQLSQTAAQSSFFGSLPTVGQDVAGLLSGFAQGTNKTVINNNPIGGN